MHILVCITNNKWKGKSFQHRYVVLKNILFPEKKVGKTYNSLGYIISINHSVAHFAESSFIVVVHPVLTSKHLLDPNMSATATFIVRTLGMVQAGFQIFFLHFLENMEVYA